MQLVEEKKLNFSQREQECLSYLLEGFTFKRIGRALGLSHRTIELYVKNMRMKVGAANKRELIGKVMEVMKTNNERSEPMRAGEFSEIEE